jgi:alpha-beta hydrolase superfamily lysophospholipase
VGAGQERLVHNAAARRFMRRVPRGSYTELRPALHEILMETDDQRVQFWRVFDRLAADVVRAD